MTGSSSSGRVRRADDYYPTPPDATRALIAAEHNWLEYHSRLWEPACGQGAMARELDTAGHAVWSTDLVDRGWGTGGVDFLTTTEIPMGCTAIVTNPPFNIAEKFIVHALDRLGAPYLCLLLKSTFWHAVSRVPTFVSHPPSVVYPMTWRPDFLGLGAPTMEAMWCVWDKSRTHETIYRLLHRQRVFEDALLFDTERYAEAVSIGDAAAAVVARLAKVPRI